jgi:hypothetical protein
MTVAETNLGRVNYLNNYRDSNLFCTSNYKERNKEGSNLGALTDRLPTRKESLQKCQHSPNWCMDITHA